MSKSQGSQELGSKVNVGLPKKPKKMKSYFFIGMAFILVATVLLLFYFRRRTAKLQEEKERKKRQELSQQPVGYYDYGPYGWQVAQPFSPYTENYYTQQSHQTNEPQQPQHVQQPPHREQQIEQETETCPGGQCPVPKYPPKKNNVTTTVPPRQPKTGVIREVVPEQQPKTPKNVKSPISPPLIPIPLNETPQNNQNVRTENVVDEFFDTIEEKVAQESEQLPIVRSNQQVDDSIEEKEIQPIFENQGTQGTTQSIDGLEEQQDEDIPELIEQE